MHLKSNLDLKINQILKMVDNMMMNKNAKFHFMDMSEDPLIE
jgi:hypothetical protein